MVDPNVALLVLVLAPLVRVSAPLVLVLGPPVLVLRLVFFQVWEHLFADVVSVATLEKRMFGQMWSEEM